MRLGRRLSWGLAMNSEDPSHDKQPLVMPFRSANGVRRLHKSPPRDHEFLDVLSLPLREDKTLSDDEWRQRSVDNILALLKANAELRALAVKLSDILAARGGWDRNSLDKAARPPSPHAQNPHRS
jgi:hypothetical protein